MLPAAIGRSNSETPCSPMKVAIVTTIAGRRSEVINKTLQQAPAGGGHQDQNKARRKRAGGNAVRSEERGQHDAQPGERTDRRSMAPTSTVASCALDRKVRMLEEGSMLLMLKGERKYPFKAWVPPRMMAVRTASTRAGK